MLLTSRELSAFEEYYGVDFGSEYKLGLVLQCDDLEVLGDPGIDLDISCAGHGFSDIPGIDVFFAASSSSDLGSSNIQIASLGWGILTPGTATYNIRGQLGRGMNILLLSEAGSGGTAEATTTTPSFGPLAQGATQVGGSDDCTPDIPSPPVMGCQPEPDDDDGCPLGNCGPVACFPPHLIKGPTRCGGSNDSYDFIATTTVKEGVTISIKWTAPPMEAGIEGTGDVEGSSSEAGHMGFGNGNGCGECKSAYGYIVKCFSECTSHKKEGACWPFTQGSCVDVIESIACYDSYEGTSPPCPRTCH